MEVVNYVVHLYAWMIISLDEVNFFDVKVEKVFKIILVYNTELDFT